MLTETTRPSLKVTVVVADGSPFEPSGNYAVQALREMGLNARSGTPEVAFESLEANGADRVLLVSERALGPLSSLDDFLANAAGRGAFGLVEDSDPEGPLRIEPVVLYVDPTRLEPGLWGECVRRVRGELCGDQGEADVLGALRSALREAGVAVPGYVDVSRPPEEYSRSRSFLRDGLDSALSSRAPFLPWDVFIKDPLALERWAINPTAIMEEVFDRGYPRTVFWETLLGAAPPPVWFANTGQYKILAGSRVENTTDSVSTADGPPPKVGSVDAVVQVVDLANLPPLLRALGNMPQLKSITVHGPQDAVGVLNRLRAHTMAHFAYVGAPKRALANGSAAFLHGGLDTVGSGAEILVFLSDQLANVNANVLGTPPHEQVVANLLASPDHAADLLGLFEDDPRRGLIFPPMPLGAPQQSPAVSGCEDVSRKVRGGVPGKFLSPLDTQVVPPAATFMARREALMTLTGVLRDVPAQRIECLAPTQVGALVANASYAEGFYATMAQTLESARAQSLAMETRTERISSHLYPYARQAVAILEELVRKHGRSMSVGV